MRWTRPLLLVAILVIVGGVGATFYSRLKRQYAGTPAKPVALPEGTSASSQGWSYTETRQGKPVVYVHAEKMEETEGKFHLDGVELHIFQKEASQYDLVKSAKSEFDMNKGELFSDGDVEITMGVPASGGALSGRMMRIKSSGVKFESKTGKADTDRPTTFAFDRGEGSAVGATYDPQVHELHMKSQVHLLWRGQDGKGKPMIAEAGDATYKEKESKVYMGGWSKMVRDTFTMNAGPAVVNVHNGAIQHVETERAVGTDVRPNRKIEYAAAQLTMNMDDSGEIQKIVGDRDARLVSSTDTAQTTITTDRIDLDFNTATRESILDTALATGHSIASSKPITKQGTEPPDTRILKSEVIKTKMRPDGREIDNVETVSAGSLEFVPNRAGQPHRWMNGDKLWMKYGEKNQLESFRSTNVTTRTEKPAAAGAKNSPPPAITSSQNLTAEFDPKTSQLAKLEQWNNFRYEEGARKAKADRAILEQAKNLIHLTGGARVWDPTGVTDSDAILLDQKSGDFSATGSVNSTRLPDKKKEGGTGGMLNGDEPLHAKAKKMFSTDNNLLVRYEGDAVAWQGPNRLQGDVIEIDRDNNILKAHGRVVSQLLDKNDESTAPGQPKEAKPAPKPAKPVTAPVFTIVKAPELIYNDGEKLAHYRGGVQLERPDMKIQSSELRAFLRDSEDDSDSSLDHAFADGKVTVVQTTPDRIRTGTSDHAEYYVDEGKVILETGHPQLVDSVKGITKGRKLTWYSNDDRLLVDGAEGQPAQTKLRRK